MTDVVERDHSALQHRLPPEPVPRAGAARKLIVLTSRQPDPRAIARDGNSGGLLAALGPAVERTSGTWIAGSPAADAGADTVGPASAPGTDAESAPWRAVSVRYPAALHRGYHARLANGVLRPLYHGLLHEMATCRSSDWEDYRLVNRHFAAAAAEQVGPDSLVWVHDYQLSLVLALLRDLGLNNLRLGFFLHTPFPIRHVPDAAMGARRPARHARRRPHRLSYRRLPAQLLRLRAAPARHRV